MSRWVCRTDVLHLSARQLRRIPPGLRVPRPRRCLLLTLPRVATRQRPANSVNTKSRAHPCVRDRSRQSPIGLAQGQFRGVQGLISSQFPDPLSIPPTPVRQLASR